MSEKTIYKDETIVNLRRPKMYRVVLLNDDYTTMEFVVEILVKVFRKNATEATKIMMDVHEKGKGVVGVYTYDIAQTKIVQTEEMAKENEFPLRAVMEEE